MNPLLQEPVIATVEALLIGFLVGAQREAAREPDEITPGVRDFVLIAIVGALCGLLALPWLTAAALASIGAMIVVFPFTVGRPFALTTSIAAVATFCLAFLTATRSYPNGAALAIGITIAVVALLEAKRAIHRFVRETITSVEFEGTLRFLALVFIVYPILPEGRFGPYGFFAPRALWLFVILICSISYLGYFLEKFLGTRAGLRLSGILGGLASSTAATASLSRTVTEEPEKFAFYGQAVAFANAIQFPRVLAIIWFLDAPLARGAALPLAAMCVAGLAFGVAMSPRGPSSPERVAIRDPFRLKPALQFAAVVTAVLFFTKAAAQLGGSAVYWTSALGGSVDSDAAAVSLSDLSRSGALPVPDAVTALLLALMGNAVVKTGIALNAAGRKFGGKVALSFAVMFGAGLAVWGAARWISF
jgi:uncharacterized membrane protein (DUF4010 family)